MIRGLPSFTLFSIAVLAAAGGVDPQHAEATCGDWLSRHSVGEASATAAMPEELPASRNRNETPPRPFCDGPQCRSAPADSAPGTTGGLIVRVVDQWAAGLEDAGDVGRGERKPLRLALTQHAAAGFRSRIERPPRLSALS
ncbi:MAG: hypothetical protein KY476_09950 [Planctomycetes bacterium]|nr:hypothetical protein [Planctomycetota bacterium]